MAEDVTLTADGLSIQGEVLVSLEHLAGLLAVTPEEALGIAVREALAERRSQAEGKV